MHKVSAGRGHQRLLQLARSQLGHEFATKTSSGGTEPAPQVQSSDFNQRHQRLAQRSGAPLAVDADFKGPSLYQRAERRERMHKERQQANLEKIMALALDYCPDYVADIDVDPDWFQQYCDLVLNISNQTMQQLWAKILAGEIGQPGSFSLKTLFLLQRMSFKEALALQKAASLTCRVRLQDSGHIYFGYVRKPSIWQILTGRSKALLNLSQFGLTFPQILSLIDLNLLHQTEIESGELIPDQSLQLQYHQHQLTCKARHSGVVLQYYKFTAVGVELLPLLNCQANPAYLQAMKQLFSPVLEFED
ncbi:MAG: TIGR03899 family protein [Gammaproteobacteria bacterium]|nr:TIGR03899 family protein [Gammaproteobacteria bacterium]MBU2059633.1 TIGR03899 family protein [Gammaproteobacteria bacterium]MBU2176068.1 TIGR03899 family protein [Gammaproteobacteria bacterium]MBU2245256.1 TIGR03899 family protein [Gammaproteobacteria bacterium]MBU2343842.1 TIGR03899 family protein [Gammaproteobacteria bacterium]